MSTTRPRYIPTLTEVVSPSPGAPAPSRDAVEDEERLLRVLQRVEVLLDQRLSRALGEAADALALQFTDRLKRDLSPLVKELVAQALAEELNPGTHPRGDEQNG